MFVNGLQTNVIDTFNFNKDNKVIDINYFNLKES